MKERRRRPTTAERVGETGPGKPLLERQGFGNSGASVTADAASHLLGAGGMPTRIISVRSGRVHPTGVRGHRRRCPFSACPRLARAAVSAPAGRAPIFVEDACAVGSRNRAHPVRRGPLAAALTPRRTKVSRQPADPRRGRLRPKPRTHSRHRPGTVTACGDAGQIRTVSLDRQYQFRATAKALL